MYVKENESGKERLSVREMGRENVIGRVHFIEFSSLVLELCNFLGEGKQSFVFMAKKNCKDISEAPNVVKQSKRPSPQETALLKSWKKAAEHGRTGQYLNPIIEIKETADGKQFSLSKLVPGETLDNFLKDSPDTQKVPLAKALGAFHAELEGAARSAGYFIFDTAKLDNIMVTVETSGNLKLTAIDAVVIPEDEFKSKWINTDHYPRLGLEKAYARWGYPALSEMQLPEAPQAYIKEYTEKSQTLDLMSEYEKDSFKANFQRDYVKWAPSLASDDTCSGLRNMVMDTFIKVLRM